MHYCAFKKNELDVKLIEYIAGEMYFVAVYVFRI